MRAVAPVVYVVLAVSACAGQRAASPDAGTEDGAPPTDAVDATAAQDVDPWADLSAAQACDRLLAWTTACTGAPPSHPGDCAPAAAALGPAAAPVFACLTRDGCRALVAADTLRCLEDLTGPAPAPRRAVCEALDLPMERCRFSVADRDTARLHCLVAAHRRVDMVAVQQCAARDVGPRFAPPNPPPLDFRCAAFEGCVRDSLGLAGYSDWGSDDP